MRFNKMYSITLQFCIIFRFASFYVQGIFQVCQDVQSPSIKMIAKNCSLVCNVNFEYAVSGIHLEELALCVKNTSVAVTCNTHVDCRHHHPGSYCKQIPCLCKADQVPHNYILDSTMRMPKLSTCVVSARNMHPDSPIVPFPWQTLLIVAGIVMVFATCLICIRWLSPLIRSMQAKRSTRENRENRQEISEDNTSLFTAIPPTSEAPNAPLAYYFPRGIPRIYRATPRNSQRSSQRGNRATRARYLTCAQAEGTLSGTLSNQDKPPPYETAIQLPPPTYEDVERAIILESRNVGSEHRQRVEVHVVPSSATLPATAGRSAQPSS